MMEFWTVELHHSGARLLHVAPRCSYSAVDLASALRRIDEKPYVLGSLAMLWGWVKGAIRGKPRYADAEFRKFLRRYQWRALLVGKKRAIEEIDEEISVV